MNALHANPISPELLFLFQNHQKMNLWSVCTSKRYSKILNNWTNYTKCKSETILSKHRKIAERIAIIFDWNECRMSVDIILFASNNVQSRATTNKTQKSGKITKKEKREFSFFFQQLSMVTDRLDSPSHARELTSPYPTPSRGEQIMGKLYWVPIYWSNVHLVLPRWEKLWCFVVHG